MIELIPAIDIIDGRCVRLTKGDYNSLQEYSSDPVETARSFESAGFTRLHLVDLDGTKKGEPVNLHILEAICQSTKLTIDYGGGVKTNEDIEKVFSAGAAMVTGGSVAVKNPDLFLSWLEKYGADRIILGADVRNRRVAVSGWKEQSDRDLFGFLDFFVSKGIRKVVCTDIDRDGTLEGPAVSLYREILESYPGIDLIASGGVGREDHIRELDKAGVKSIIAGKAFYEGKIAMRPWPLETLSRRIIPCLDVKDGRVVKGVNFVGLRDAGDPVELAQRYSDEGADELVFLDITATHEKRKTLAQLVRRVAEAVSIPFTVGGGISSVADVSAMLANGADKVSVNSAAVRNPEIINSMAGSFGSQCIVLAVDARYEEGRWQVYLNGGRLPMGIELFGWIKEAADRGAGEILFTSMDHDGTRNGFANEALAEISSMVNIPLIASGGAGKPEHFRDAFTKGRADAALAAGIFHYGEISIAQVKEYLREQGIRVRL